MVEVAGHEEVGVDAGRRHAPFGAVCGGVEQRPLGAERGGRETVGLRDGGEVGGAAAEGDAAERLVVFDGDGLAVERSELTAFAPPCGGGRGGLVVEGEGDERRVEGAAKVAGTDARFELPKERGRRGLSRRELGCDFAGSLAAARRRQSAVTVAPAPGRRTGHHLRQVVERHAGDGRERHEAVDAEDALHLLAEEEAACRCAGEIGCEPQRGTFESYALHRCLSFCFCSWRLDRWRGGPRCGRRSWRGLPEVPRRGR